MTNEDLVGRRRHTTRRPLSRYGGAHRYRDVCHLHRRPQSLAVPALSARRGHPHASCRQEVRIVVGRNNPLQRAMASAGLELSFPIFGSMDDALS